MPQAVYSFRQAQAKALSVVGGSDAYALQDHVQAILTPTIAIPLALWTLLTLDVQRGNRAMTIENTSDHIGAPVVAHRREKLRLLKNFIPSMLLSWTVACLAHKTLPWNPASSMWAHGPQPHLVGLSFGFWASEVTLDACLDECDGMKTYTTEVVALLTMIILISKLTRAGGNMNGVDGGGHVVFVMKACETMCSTSLGRTMDHSYWYAVAVSAVLLLGAGLATGTLAPKPSGVKTQALLAYFLITVGSSPVYQMVQNLTKIRVRAWHVWTVRQILLALAVVFAGTPAAWMILDATNFAVFLLWKTGADSVVLRALQS